MIKSVRHLAFVSLLSPFVACHSPATPSKIDPQIVETIFLIGDAGEPDPRLPDVTLDSLAAQAAAAGDRGTILFLGDNVYPEGIAAPTAASYPDALRRLDAQIRIVPRGGRGIFLPGNHDWADGGRDVLRGSSSASDGLFIIRNQGALIEQRARRNGATVRMLPRNGCPGPVVVDHPRVRLILLDTQWWLHNYMVRDSVSDDPEAGCSTHTVSDIVRAVKDSLRTKRPGQSVIVAGHHPMRTGGPHGGYCGVFALFRRWAKSSQDLFGGSYRMMRDSLSVAMASNPPLIFAAGHDHSLQVLSGRTSKYVLVSGAGSIGKGECAVRLRESLFVAQATSGFMRLDFTAGDSVRLGVYRYDGHVNGEVYSRWLRDQR
jgi:hypothetical protein